MDSEKQPLLAQKPAAHCPPKWSKLIFLIPVIFFTALLAPIFTDKLTADDDCFDPVDGYKCLYPISRNWGQYSPYFKVQSNIPSATPDGCEITFAQVLSRHGARDPTLKRTLRLSGTVITVKALGRLEGKYAFLNDYVYDLGADKLNEFGRRQLRQSGREAKTRYGHLGDPFVRAASQQRVIDSAAAFKDGYGTDVPTTTIYEGEYQNCSLRHSRCLNIEEGPLSNVRKAARGAWGSVFLPPIAARLGKDLGMVITQDDAHNLMSMCPMTTVHDPKGRPTPFCDLFTYEEFRQYNHFEALEKFYGWGKGNPLGPTQGVGFVNEMIARMTKQPVNDWTSTNHTLNDNPKTFPLDYNFYADFSHDDDLTSVFFALGMFYSTPMLSITEVYDSEDLKGWSPARTVPFGGRAYFEKMKCNNHDEEMVRALVNGRVIPLDICGPDEFGRCKLSSFIDSLSFAREGGRWPLCQLMIERLENEVDTTLEGILRNDSIHMGHL